MKNVFRNIKTLLCMLFAAILLCSTAMAAGEVVEANLGDPFQVSIQLNAGQMVTTSMVTVKISFRPLDGSVDHQLDIVNTSPGSGYFSARNDNEIYLISPSDTFSGHLCTLDMVLRRYESTTDTAMLTYSVEANGAEIASGMQVIWVKSRSTPHITSAPIRTVKVGDRIEMGTYEQDDYFNNGAEPIVWRVLAVENDRALLISDKILDQEVYHPKQTAVTWESCFLRGWLNHDFFNTAFSADEQAQILEVTVPAHESPYYHDESSRKAMGNATRDRIFLLSAREANEYFNSDWDRIAYPTQYAIFRGVSVDTVHEACGWLLRQPHKQRTNTACTNEEGKTNDGVNISFDGAGIRPAMWIKLN